MQTAFGATTPAAHPDHGSSRVPRPPCRSAPAPSGARRRKVVKDDVATVRPVRVARINTTEAVLDSGLEPGEVVVTNGQLQLTTGTKVAPREMKVGAR